MNGREVLADELRLAVRNVEMDIVEGPRPISPSIWLGRRCRGASLAPLVIIGHEAVAGDRMLEDTALAANRLGDQEILTCRL